MWSKLFVSIVVVVLSVDLFRFLEALKAEEDGVCVVKISTRKTRVKMITINKWCGKKKCVKKKIETYTVPEERIVCCNGWEYEVQSDTCGPICSTGCIGGRCVAPEVCHCDPPATLDPDHKNACRKPICNPPCVNSHCGGNNTCICSPEFTVFNATHCYKCENGYSIDKDFKCAPVCEKVCQNGHCTAPNTCTCLDGYSSVNDTCKPICEVCVNSTCVAPNTCSCLEGYEELNNTVCVPKCDHCDGDCVAPNVCVCHPGYKNFDGVCKPVCDACVNGHCSSPGQCTCNDGYVMNGSHPAVCVKSCGRPIEVVERWYDNRVAATFESSATALSGGIVSIKRLHQEMGSSIYRCTLHLYCDHQSAC